MLYNKIDYLNKFLFTHHFSIADTFEQKIGLKVFRTMRTCLCRWSTSVQINTDDPADSDPRLSSLLEFLSGEKKL